MDCTSPVLGIYPCGKCLNCRARNRQEWVFRLRQEYLSCNFGLFVTLTYSDEKLPPDGVCVRDVQLFLKRLRKNWKAKAFRYYIVSEYGDHTLRPHYHGLFFFAIERSEAIYDQITNAWQNGFTQFGDIEEGSIVYCTKYCLKGSDVPPGKNENFRLVSKMYGGLGVDYIDRQKDYHMKRLERPILAAYRGDSAPLPRYYREKYLTLLPDAQRIRVRNAYQRYMQGKREELLVKEYYKYIKKAGLTEEYPGSWWSEFISFKGIADMQIYNRRAELFNKHTKKQNIL